MNQEAKKVQVLVIEDDKPHLIALTKKLTDASFEVATAENGTTGLEMAIRLKPELIITDVIMPVLDGLDMIEKLRQDSWGKSAKVIVLTNMADDERQERAKQLEVIDYFIKSDISLAELVTKIQECLGN